MGKGVSKAVENVNTIIGPALVGMNPADQKAIGAPRGVTRLAPRIAR
jgi:enolase